MPLQRLYRLLYTTLLPLLLLGACRSSGIRLDGTGNDYFDGSFVCTTAPLPAEQEGSPYRVRYELYRQKFFREEQKGITAPFAILTGDSTAALFLPARLKQALPGIDIVNRGIPGDTTALLLTRLEEDIIAVTPQVVIVVIGGNDLIAGRCLPVILKNTETILASLHQKLPEATVVIVSIPPVTAWKPNTISPIYNERLRRVALRYPKTHYFDLWPILADPDLPELKQEFQIPLPHKKVDSVHFNEKGYAAWGKAMLPLLKRIAKKSAHHR